MSINPVHQRVVSILQANIPDAIKADLEPALMELGEIDPQALRYVIALMDIREVSVAQNIRRQAYRFLGHDESVDLASHTRSGEDKASVVGKARERLISNGNPELLGELALMANGPLGLFLLTAGGLDWDHTDWLFNPDLREMVRRLSNPDTDVENFFFNEAPGFLATQERFGIFQQELLSLIEQGKIREGDTIASIPCGRMRDLLTLEMGGLHLNLVAIDKDPAALAGARELAILRKKTNVQFLRADALDLSGQKGRFHGLFSNGLNIYYTAKEAEKLYANFHMALRRGGNLRVSQTTPLSDWKPGVDMSKVVRQQVLTTQVAQARWGTHLRSVAQTCAQLESVGFEVPTVRSGSSGIFQTFATAKH